MQLHAKRGEDKTISSALSYNDFFFLIASCCFWSTSFLFPIFQKKIDILAQLYLILISPSSWELADLHSSPFWLNFKAPSRSSLSSRPLWKKTATTDGPHLLPSERCMFPRMRWGEVRWHRPREWASLGMGANIPLLWLAVFNLCM